VRAVSGPGPLTGVTQLALGVNHSCALLGSGQVRCWGFNDAGQLGTRTGYTSFNRPKVVLNESGTGPLKNVIAIDAGGSHTCALLANREVRCWGDNSAGSLGDGTFQNRQVPRPVKSVAGNGRLTGVTQITVGSGTTCARLNTGQARCWGDNEEGQVGDGTEQDRNRPRVVRAVSGPGPLTGVTQVSAGAGTTCARLQSGQAWCWGEGEDGGLGNGSVGIRTRPVVVGDTDGTGPLTGVATVEAGSGTACARVGSQLRCWGNGIHGQMGNGVQDEENFVPVAVENQTETAVLTGVTRFSLTDRHACARLANGQARCWGLGVSGQLGDGNLDSSAVVVPVRDGT
jgi:alpha-tubulin suppressor-like RCC1 family protein